MSITRRSSMIFTRRRAIVLVGFVFAGTARGQDEVTWLNRRQQPETRSGEIIKYDADELQLRFSQGTTRRIPADRVIDIQIQRVAEHERADEAFERQDFATALTLYRAAYRAESRQWVKRRIAARSILCLRYVGQLGEAAITFLALWQQDAHATDVSVIPLAWRAERSDPALDAKTPQWLGPTQPPVAQLIAASWELPGKRRTAARQVLQKLAARDSGGWIGQLAAAQIWRIRRVTADREEVRRWQSTLENIPRKLQPGPTFVVAQTLARLQDTDAAVLAYLQIPLLHPQQRVLAAESLWEAATLLQRAKRPTEAHRLFRELTRRYRESPLADKADRQ